MNTIIHTINFLGQHLGDFAGSMLLQSSVLIALIWMFDMALRHKLRASVRYALWLIVLVKLVCPPSLALPTGIGWWLRSAGAVEPQPRSFGVSYAPGEGAVAGGQAIAAMPAAVPLQVSTSGWVFLGCAAVSFGLLGWLMARWRRVALELQQSTPAGESVGRLLEEARVLSGLRRRVELRLTERSMSPAVCGLFRPVVVLPLSLVEQLPPDQLRAVLLHELIHLRRGDLWVSFGQSLLQIAYWWHPMLWFANAQIRRVREEAVDDGVMTALAEDGDAYAPTLLEVAKRRFDRPLASLGFLGILESRSALRSRIERLVSPQGPRRTGLTILSVLCIAVFGAVAVPMGEAPSAASQPASPSTVSNPGSSPLAMPVIDNAEELSRAAVGPFAGRHKIKVQTRFIELTNFDPTNEPPNSSARALASLLDAKPPGVVTDTPVTPELRSRFHLPASTRLVASSNGPAMGVLSERQTQIILKQLEERPGTDVRSGPALEMAEGTLGRVVNQAVTTVVTGVETNDDVLRKFAGVSYTTTSLPIGPELDITPRLEPDGRLTLKLEENVIEFVGYDKPAKEGQVTYMSAKNKPTTIKYQTPLPRLRLLQSAAQVSIADGQTLLLGGLVSVEIQKVKDSVPVLSSIPLAGRLFRHETSMEKKKHLFLLVTPTVEKPDVSQ